MAVKLTSLGIQEAEKVSAHLGMRESMLAYMYEIGEPVEPEEVLEYVGADTDERGLRVLRKLIGDRYVVEV